MKKVTNHKGWLTAILSIIPFFIFSAIFQGLGFVFTSLLGSRGAIDFDFDKYIESDYIRKYSLFKKYRNNL